MKELGITKGEWTISPDNNWECCVLMGDQIDHYINFENRDIDGWEEMHANATLVCDAGNTAQKCGLLPSELLQQRDRCLMTLSNCRETIEMLQREIPGEQIVLRHEMASRLNDIEAAIKNTEK